MARQHAELLGAEIRQGILPFAARMLTAHLQTAGDLPTRAINRVGRALLESFCLTVARNMPAAYRRAFHTLAREAGLSTRQADLALGTPDVALIVLGWVERLTSIEQRLPRLLSARWPAYLPRLQPRAGFPGCSGVVALPEATRSGHLLHGRNMDYDGLGYLDRFPTVAFCRPVGGQPFAWVGSAGLHTTALTGMNASGIFLGSNTAPSLDASLRGVPFFAVNERAVREAKTLGQAVDLLSQDRPASGYNVHVSHGPSGDAAVVEYAYSRHCVRGPEDGLLTVTNHYVTPEMAQTIPRVMLVDTANTEGRYQRLRARLEAERGAITLPYLADCLRDHTEHATSTEHPLGDVVGNWMNLTSVVADVTQGRFFVTADPAPAALGRYVSFDFHRELEAFRQPRAYAVETIEPSPAATGPGWAAIQAYQQAHAALAHRAEPEVALSHLEAAQAALPQEPRIALSLALLALKVNRVALAEAQAARYLELAPPPDPRRYRAHLVRAWCAELAGRTAEARALYGHALAENPHQDESDLELERWRRRPFTEADRRNLHVDLFNAKRMFV
jgi:hypothetical protein